MARKTEARKQQKSFATGMQVLGGADVPVYTLQHLTSTVNHTMGKSEKIIVPYIELGRDKTCAVRFGEDVATVSRKHAAIERNGNEVLIKNLSGTNPTLVNGRPVAREWYLNNGDEIQLSLEGPKLLYNTTPTGTRKMGFTNKMNLVVQQAIRPYRNYVITLALFLLASIGASGYLFYENWQIKEREQARITEYNNRVEIDSLARTQLRDSLRSFQGQYDSLAGTNKALEDAIENNKQELAKIRKNSSAPSAVTTNIKVSKEHVYSIEVEKIEIKDSNGQLVKEIDGGWSCTGFLCEDGKFVTARHCIESWRFLTPPELAAAINAVNSNNIDPRIAFNIYELQGFTIDVHIDATSPDNDVISFTNQYVVKDNSKDIVERDIPLKAIQKSVDISLVPLDSWYTDWAYHTSNKQGSIKYDKNLSSNLESGTEVFVLGYPFGLGSTGKIEPLLSKSTVAVSGLRNGVILLTDRNFESGNSGGPVFVQKGNEFVCIGIVSSGKESIGFVVPIAHLQ